jgi:hypothetical protein
LQSCRAYHPYSALPSGAPFSSLVLLLRNVKVMDFNYREFAVGGRGLIPHSGLSRAQRGREGQIFGGKDMLIVNRRSEVAITKSTRISITIMTCTVRMIDRRRERLEYILPLIRFICGTLGFSRASGYIKG